MIKEHSVNPENEEAVSENQIWNKTLMFENNRYRIYIIDGSLMQDALVRIDTLGKEIIDLGQLLDTQWFYGLVGGQCDYCVSPTA